MDAPSTRVTLTCVAFNVAQVLKGKDGRTLLDHGMLHLRRALTREVGVAPVIVYADGCYAILDIGEVMVATGRPPAGAYNGDRELSRVTALPYLELSVRALGAAVARHAAIYVWLEDKRPKGWQEQLAPCMPSARLPT